MYEQIEKSIKRDWTPVKKKIAEKWSKFNDRELESFKGNISTLEDSVKKTYQLDQERANRDVKQFVGTFASGQGDKGSEMDQKNVMEAEGNKNRPAQGQGNDRSTQGSDHSKQSNDRSAQGTEHSKQSNDRSAQGTEHSKQGNDRSDHNRDDRSKSGSAA